MLSECRSNYENLANYIPGWLKISKSELCFSYIRLKEQGDPSAEYYLSALIAKYLRKMEIEYNSQYYKNISEDDYYNMLIECILFVVRSKAWEDENSSLYKNENAPEIAINTCIKNSVVNQYIYLQRDKRKSNNGALSLNLLEENSSEGYFIPYNDEDISADLYVKELIKSYFNDKEYLNAFVLDAILNKNVFVDGKDGVRFSLSKLKTSIRNINKSYCKVFSNNYEISLKEVEDSLKYCQGISHTRLDTSIQRFFKILKRDKELSMLVHNAY